LEWKYQVCSKQDEIIIKLDNMEEETITGMVVVNMVVAMVVSGLCIVGGLLAMSIVFNLII